MIVAAWKRAVEPQITEVPVYNCSTSIQRKFTTGFIVEMGRKLAADVPLDKMLWLPGGSITKCKYNNLIRVNNRLMKIQMSSSLFIHAKKSELCFSFELNFFCSSFRFNC